MKTIFAFAWLFVLWACHTPPPAQDTPARVVAADYAQPFFADSARAENVKKAAAVVESLFRKYAAENNIPGLAYGVVVGDQLVIANGFGVASLSSQTPVTTQTLFRIASMSKSFTALAILRLRDEGKLQLTDPVEKYITAFSKLRYPTADSPRITIEHLMTMAAGFPEDNPWGDRQLADTDEELIHLLEAGLSFSNAPGIGYEYSNQGFASLGKIITEVSGQPYQQYIRAKILAPLGMHHAQWDYRQVPPENLALGYRWEDEQWKEEPLLADGSYGAMGGLICSVAEFARYLSLHMQAWPPRSGAESPVALRSTLREMHQLHNVSGVMNQYRNKPCPVVTGYGYGLGYRKDCRGITTLRHGGGLPGFGSEWRFYQEYGIGIVSLSNRTYAGLGNTNAQVLDTLIQLANLQPRQLPASPVLVQRQQEIVRALKQWQETDLDIFAENFFLDRSLVRWKADTQTWWAELGPVMAVTAVVPENQLRGTFAVEGTRKDLQVFFTLTPEREPRVQQLDVSLIDKP
ncbi:MAG: beta-lactamase family protein [Cyclobacteriaceae bacterium]|nr:beta-lactamase family protein [Cyclobacteriaceae bacterium]